MGIVGILFLGYMQLIGSSTHIRGIIPVRLSKTVSLSDVSRTDSYTLEILKHTGKKAANPLDLR